MYIHIHVQCTFVAQFRQLPLYTGMSGEDLHTIIVYTNATHVMPTVHVHVHVYVHMLTWLHTWTLTSEEFLVWGRHHISPAAQPAASHTYPPSAI